MKRGWSARIAAFLIAATALAGCGAGDEEEPSLDIQAIVDSTTEFQKAILDDGEVSPSEYEEALLAYRTCVEDSGARPSEIYVTGNHEKTFDYEVVASDDQELEEINSLAEACLPEYFADVGRVWAYQQLLSPDELDGLRSAVAECLRSVGLDVDDDVTLDDAMRA